MVGTLIWSILSCHSCIPKIVLEVERASEVANDEKVVALSQSNDFVNKGQEDRRGV